MGGGWQWVWWVWVFHHPVRLGTRWCCRRLLECCLRVVQAAAARVERQHGCNALSWLLMLYCAALPPCRLLPPTDKYVAPDEQGWRFF